MSQNLRASGSGSSQFQRDMNRSGRTQADLVALVHWLTGVDAGSMTANVDVDWILNFDPDNFNSKESYTVEWRQPPMPKNGYPLFDCYVLQVSRDVDFNRRRMAAIESSSDRDMHHTPVSSRQGNQSEPNLFLRDIHNILRNSLTQGISLRQPGGSMSSFTSNSTSSSDENQHVMKVGSALVVSNSAYIAAKAASSPSSMTATLVKAGFSQRRLRRSSYAGQKRGEIKKPGLKKYQKMQDIQDFVRTRFPYFSQSAFGAAVNSCLGKNVDKEKKKDLVMESDSDEEN